MVLLEPYMVKVLKGAGDLELEAKTGKSLFVKDIQVYNPVSNYATITIQKTSVGYVRVGGTLGNHLHFPLEDSEKQTILGYLFDKEIFRGYPIAEGEKLTISGVGQSGAIQKVIYEEWEAGDKTSDMPNGSKADEYEYISYGTVSANVTTAGETACNVANNPKEFIGFPWEVGVPAKKVIEVIGVLASDFFAGTGTTGQGSWTENIKMFKEREVFFDEDKRGILMDAESQADTVDVLAKGQSNAGNYSDTDRRLPLIFPTSLSFSEGEELNVSWLHDAKAVAGTILTTELEIGLILRVRRVV